MSGRLDTSFGGNASSCAGCLLLLLLFFGIALFAGATSLAGQDATDRGREAGIAKARADVFISPAFAGFEGAVFGAIMGGFSEGKHKEKQDVVLYGAGIGGIVGLGRLALAGVGSNPGKKMLGSLAETDSAYVDGFSEGYRTEAARRKRQGAVVTAFTLAAGYMVAGILAGNWEKPVVVVVYGRVRLGW